MKIAVIAGGISNERNVSLVSGAMVANALSKEGFEVLLVDLVEGVGKNFCFNPPYKANYEITEIKKKVNLKALKKKYKNRFVGKNIKELFEKSDAVFFALHGGIGENGIMKAFAECIGAKTVGNSSKSELLSSDKHLSKLIFKESGIKTPDWITLKKDADIPKEINFPVFVKPCSSGSSVGISLARNEAEFKKALRKAFKEEDTALIEEKIEGREFSVGVLLNEALPPIEIKPKNGFYDYKNKYEKGKTEEICPAYITKELEKELKAAALKAHRCLGLTDISRSDFIVTEQNEIYCLETNAMPGMTPLSLFPQEAKAMGISYGEVCKRLVKSALKKQTD